MTKDGLQAGRKRFMVQTIRQAIQRCARRRGQRRRDGSMVTVHAAGTSKQRKLGYLGLGLMGALMTRRLLEAGYDVTVWNRSSGKAEALVEAGAKHAAKPQEVASAASIIFMCLTDAAAV